MDELLETLHSFFEHLCVALILSEIIGFRSVRYACGIDGKVIKWWSCIQNMQNYIHKLSLCYLQHLHAVYMNWCNFKTLQYCFSFNELPLILASFFSSLFLFHDIYI